MVERQEKGEGPSYTPHYRSNPLTNINTLAWGLVKLDHADTRRKLNVYKTFRRRPRRLLNVLCTFNLRPVSKSKSNEIELLIYIFCWYKIFSRWWRYSQDYGKYLRWRCLQGSWLCLWRICSKEILQANLMWKSVKITNFLLCLKPITCKVPNKFDLLFFISYLSYYNTSFQ